MNPYLLSVLVYFVISAIIILWKAGFDLENLGDFYRGVRADFKVRNPVGLAFVYVFSTILILVLAPWFLSWDIAGGLKSSRSKEG